MVRIFLARSWLKLLKAINLDSRASEFANNLCVCVCVCELREIERWWTARVTECTSGQPARLLQLQYSKDLCTFGGIKFYYVGLCLLWMMPGQYLEVICNVSYFGLSRVFDKSFIVFGQAETFCLLEGFDLNFFLYFFN